MRRRRSKHRVVRRLLASPVALLLVLAVQGAAGAYPGYLRRIDTAADWDSIALGSPGIKHVVPGPDPDSLGPGREPVPGAEELPCLDFVLYGPGIQHTAWTPPTRATTERSAPTTRCS